jgi:hypothetical protein
VPLPSSPRALLCHAVVSFLCRTCALLFLVEPVHEHSRAREVVRRCTCLTNAAGPFSAVPLSSFPCLVHAISSVSPPWPRRRCSACTRTQATEGPSPCFTYLGPCSTFHRAVTTNPYAPAHVCPSIHRPQVRTFLATLTMNTASPKSALRALVSVSSPCTHRRFCVAPVARPPTFPQMRTHTPEGSNPSALPVQPHTYPCVPSLSISACIRVILTGAAQEFASVSPISPRSAAAVNPNASAHVCSPKPSDARSNHLGRLDPHHLPALAWSPLSFLCAITVARRRSRVVAMVTPPPFRPTAVAWTPVCARDRHCHVQPRAHTRARA